MKSYIVHYNDDDIYRMHQFIKQTFDGPGELKHHFTDTQIFVRTNIDVSCNHGMVTEHHQRELQTGEICQFEIRLNPVKQLNGKRIAIKDEDINGWVESKLSNHGFDIVCKHVQRPIVRKVHQPRTCNIIVIKEVYISGFLKITDYDAFSQFLKNGIGKNKFLGYGFLNIS